MLCFCLGIDFSRIFSFRPAKSLYNSSGCSLRIHRSSSCRAVLASELRVDRFLFEPCVRWSSRSDVAPRGPPQKNLVEAGVFATLQPPENPLATKFF